MNDQERELCEAPAPRGVTLKWRPLHDLGDHERADLRGAIEHAIREVPGVTAVSVRKPWPRLAVVYYSGMARKGAVLAVLELAVSERECVGGLDYAVYHRDGERVTMFTNMGDREHALAGLPVPSLEDWPKPLAAAKPAPAPAPALKIELKLRQDLRPGQAVSRCVETGEVTLMELTAETFAITWERINPLDIRHDDLPLRDLIAIDAAARREDPVAQLRRKRFTPDQRAAVSAHLSAQLRERVATARAADAEREVSVRCDGDWDDEVAW